MRWLHRSLPLCLVLLVGCGGEDNGEASTRVNAQARLTAVTDATNQIEAAARKAQEVKDLNRRMVESPALRTKANYQKLVAGLIEVGASFRLALDSAGLKPVAVVGDPGSFDLSDLMAEIMALIAKEQSTFVDFQEAISDWLSQQDEGSLDRASSQADEIAAQARDALIQANLKLTPLLKRAQNTAYVAAAEAS